MKCLRYLFVDETFLQQWGSYHLMLPQQFPWDLFDDVIWAIWNFIIRLSAYNKYMGSTIGAASKASPTENEEVNVKMELIGYGSISRMYFPYNEEHEDLPAHPREYP